MMDVGRHPNIELLTMSDVINVQGYVGNFQVKIKTRPRYVNLEKCTACNACSDACPMNMPDEFNLGMNQRKVAHRVFSQAVPNTYLISKDGIPPCQSACPVEQHAQGYITLIREGLYEDALRVIKEDNPFPSVCGRTCHHPCEGKCTRRYVDEPVHIMELKRFVSDYVYSNRLYSTTEPIPHTQGKRIAIVGSGPVGMTAAQDLVKQGYEVIVFEALPVAGGMMRVGIPDHRLPKSVLQRDIDDIVALGVELRLDHPIHDPVKLKEQGFDAVFLATGVSKETRLGIPGESLKGFLDGIRFLRETNLGKKVEIGEEVVVVGGGITAVDCASLAVQMGAKNVTQVFRRSRGELPFYKEEILEVENSGVKFLEKTMPIQIFGNEQGHLIGLECAKSEPTGWIDETGKRDLTIIPGTEFNLEADTVIRAIGQFSDLSYLRSIYQDMTGDNETLQTHIEGIFAHRGVIPGSGFIVNAIALGHEAARNIHCYLQGNPLPAPTKYTLPTRQWTREEALAKVADQGISFQPKVASYEQLPEVKLDISNEAGMPYTEEQARIEASRCLECAACCECKRCVWACGPEAIEHRQREQIREIEVGGIVVATGYELFQADKLAEYGYGKSPNILTSLQFERLISAGGPTTGEILTANGNKPGKVAIIHCVGSRDERAHAYCSRFCCMYSLKQAHQIKDKTGAEVYSIYMDMRTFGKDYEEFYRRIRNEGIQFIQGRPSQVTVDPETDKLFINVEDILLGRVLELEVDMLVLAVAIEPPKDADQVASTFGLGRTPDGWFAEAHPKLRPVETASAGVYLAGCAQGPRDVPDTVAHAGAAALEVVQLLNKGEVTISPTVAVVDEIKCVGCGECLLTCPYTALTRNNRLKAEVNPALCQGCGTCVATCPSGAITALHFTDEEIVAQIDGLLELAI